MCAGFVYHEILTNKILSASLLLTENPTLM